MDQKRGEQALGAPWGHRTRKAGLGGLQPGRKSTERQRERQEQSVGWTGGSCTHGSTLNAGSWVRLGRLSSPQGPERTGNE